MLSQIKNTITNKVLPYCATNLLFNLNTLTFQQKQRSLTSVMQTTVKKHLSTIRKHIYFFIYFI